MKKKHYNTLHFIVGLTCLISAIIEPTIWQRAILILMGGLNILFVNVVKPEVEGGE